jgi:hypothetical protein
MTLTTKDRKTGEFPAGVTQKRFEGALRGARIAGPQHNESVTPKRRKAQPKKKPKPAEK